MSIQKIKQELLTQDNRITAIPIFLVQQKIRDYRFDSEYADDYVWVDEELNEADDEKAAQLNEDDEWQLKEEDLGWVKTHYRDRWEFVQPFFTENAAQDYIEMNAHRLNEPRIFVESGYRNSEFEKIRNFILNYE